METASFASLSYEDPTNNGSTPGARAWRSLVAGTLIFALCNFVLVFVISRSNNRGAIQTLLFMPAFYGLIGAEVAIHAIWSVLAPVRRTIRLVTGVVAGLFLFGAFVFGFAWFANDAWARIGLPSLLCLPLIAIAVQSPLWVVKIWFRWRVILASAHVPPERNRPFQILDLLVATGAVAIAFSVARLAAPSGVPPTAFLSSVAIAALTLAAISAFTTIPVTVGTLLPRRLGLALPALVLIDLAITIGGICAFVLLAPEGPHLRWREYFALAGVAGVFFACLTGAMLLVRRLGARLVFANSQAEARV